MIAGLVLAAGEGRRFGGPKATARLDGVRLVDRAVATVREGGCHPVLVVQGAAALAPLARAQLVDADGWREGMGASLRAGLAALPAGAEAAVIMLVDTPWLTPPAVRAVIERWRATAGAPNRPGAVLASYAGHRRHPVLLAARVWPAVAGLARGDEGARPWLREHPGEVAEADCTGLADPRDVDVPEPGIQP